MSKSIPIKKHSRDNHHESGHERNYNHARKDNGTWMFVSAVLAVLLVVSIFTNGFRFNKLEAAKSSLNSILKENVPQEAKSSITQALTSLENAKSAIDQAKPAESTTTPSNYDGEKVKLEFYVMSKCPYGIQVENGVKPALDKLGDAVDFSVNFIATDNGDGTFQGLHGPTEVSGNIVQLCAMKYNPDTWMDMVFCMNQDSGNIPNNWEKCAQDNNLDVAKIKACYEGNEGKSLHSESIKKANAANAQGSPTMFINGKPYNGGRDTLSFTRALCAELPGNPDCASMPVCGSDADCVAEGAKVGKCVNPNANDAKCEYVDPSPVNVIVLNDKRCPDCQTASGLVDQLQSLFKGLKVTSYDYGDPEGKKIYEENGVQFLPAFLFDDTVKQGESYDRVQSYLAPAGKYQYLRIGATFDPKSEICDNIVDDDNNGQADCADSACKGQTVCRETKSNRLDLFVMSECPYGIQAMNSMKEVLTNFNNKVDFELHFIANDNGDGTFSSLHGQTEVDEDIRESCVMKYYPENYKFMDYIWCRNQNIKGDWQPCATQNGVDVAKIKTCSEGEEGKQLLREKIKSSNELNIGASPTWMANNKYQFAGLDANTIKTSLCQYNSGLAGCENTLSGSAQAPAGVQCG